MNEVSCKVLEIFFSTVRKNGGELREFTKDLDYSLEHLQEADNWFDWGTFLQIIERFRVYCPTRQDWVQLGRDFVRTKQLRPLTAVFRLLGGARQLFKWIFRFGGFTLFRNMTASISDEGRVVVAQLAIAESYAPCPEYFFICQGTFGTVPTVLGHPEVPVELETDGHGAVYRIRFDLVAAPPRMRFLSSGIRRAVDLFRSRRAIVAEFEQNHLLLEERYQQLETAKLRIEEQQRALQLIHEIANATHRNLSLRDTLAAIADNVVSRLGYEAVRVGVGVTDDEVYLAHEELRGDQALLAAGAHSEPIRVGARILGELSVQRASREVTVSDLALLKELTESIALAVKNAVDYEVIRSYRNSLEAKVEQRTADLVEANDKLERSLESRTRFFANINHELRTPLTVILLGARQLAGTGLPASDREKIDSVIRNADRLQTMVDELLLLASAAEQSGELQPVRMRVENLIVSVMRTALPLADAKGLELTSSVSPELDVDGDPKLLDGALVNLVGNAIKYTGAGRVVIEAAADGEFVVFSVTDTGPGIPEAYQASIFERFVQVPMTTSRPGAGLGLALVKEIATHHRGTVSVSSTLGQGTTFRLRLPRRIEGARPAVRPPLRLTPPPVEPATGPALRPTGGTQSRVLVCEDHADLSAQVREILEGDGLSVDGVSTAEQALEVAAVRPPDLLLTDLGLGAGMDGLELCRRFKQLPSHRNAPVLVLTAGRPGSKLGAFEAGAVDYLTKPFSPDELLARVRAHLTVRALSLRLVAAERLAAQGSVLAGVAHELRNPLNGIINAVGPLRQKLPRETLPPGSPAAQLLDVLEECGNRAAFLSRDLLSFVRGAPRTVEIQPFHDVVRRALLVIGPRLEGADFTTQLQAQGTIRGSGTELSQVIINLLENALESAGRHGRVEMLTEDREEQVLLEVRDSGPGVPSDLRERVFEPFFSTKPPGRGTGLGLSISQDIVRRHGGSLALSGGAGAFSVRLTLPRAPGAPS